MGRRLIALMAVLLLTAACGSKGDAGGDALSGDTAELRQVTVGVIPIVDVAPLYLGIEQGFFADEGLEVTLKDSQGGAAIIPSVVSGQFQFGFSNLTSLLLAAQEGLPVKVVANGSASTGKQGADFGGVLTLPKSGIVDAADLQGRRVSVNQLNNLGTTTINEAIRAAGGDPSTVEYVELPFPDAPGALAQGNVDAILEVEPFLTVAKQDGAVLVASPYVDTAENLTVATYFTNAQLFQDDPDLVKQFAAGVKRSLQYATENPDEARRILSTYTKIDPSVIAEMTLPAWPVEINRASIDRLAQLSVQDGYLKKVPDQSSLLP